MYRVVLDIQQYNKNISDIKTQRYSNTQFLLMSENVQRLQNYKVKDSLEWWQLILEKRCDGCAHSQKDDCYNEALRAFLT